jgi:hypothetical protein
MPAPYRAAAGNHQTAHLGHHQQTTRQQYAISEAGATDG